MKRLDPTRDLLLALGAGEQPAPARAVRISGPRAIALGSQTLRERDEERLLFAGHALEERGERLTDAGEFAGCVR